MIEVFKTNVNDRDQSRTLLEQIHNSFPGYQANFDLDDCDNILRVECSTRPVNSSRLIDLLKNLGCYAEVLPGEEIQLMS